MLLIDHVNAVVLPVRDVEKCASFYQDRLGFKLNHKDDQSAFLAIGGKGGLILGLVSINEVARLISEKQVRPREETVHRTYYAAFVEDVDREYEQLKQKGVHFVKPPTTQPRDQRAAGPADIILRGSRRKPLTNLTLPQEVRGLTAK